MATNWNVREAAKAISANEKNAIIDLGRRFPLATIAIARIKDQAAFDFLQVIPEHITMRKIEQILKGEEETTAEENTEDEGEEAEIKPETTTPAKPEAKAEGYDKMNRKQLKELIIKAGGEKRCREEFGWTTRDQLLAYINKYGLDPVNEGEATEEEAADPYEGKAAVELFKECKKRKIKAEPKKPAKFYADLLRKADAEAAKASEETEAEDEDDWGEEEEEPAKPAKKAPAKEKAAKPAKPAKPAKKEESEEDEDDWDI